MRPRVSSKPPFSWPFHSDRSFYHSYFPEGYDLTPRPSGLKSQKMKRQEYDMLDDDPLKVEDEMVENPPATNDLLDDPLNDDLLNDSMMDDMYGEGSMAPITKHKDLLKELTNFSPYLKDAINNWLGLTWNEKEQEFVRDPFLKPIMTVQGAAWCCGLLKTYARSNNIITDISQEEYKAMMWDHIQAIWLNLGTRMEDLGIKEEGDLLRVANELEHAAALVLMGAGNGKYNKFLGSTYSHHSSQNMGADGRPNNMGIQHQKKGIVNKIARFFVGDGI